jgi:hypothetical protein
LARLSGEPLGTTRIGQAIIGIVGAALGFGFAIGLLLDRSLFEPLLILSFLALADLSRYPVDYDPAKYEFYIAIIALNALIWLGLFAWAFIRQPAKDRALDRNLRARDTFDISRRATIVAEDDPIA